MLSLSSKQAEEDPLVHYATSHFSLIASESIELLIHVGYL